MKKQSAAQNQHPKRDRWSVLPSLTALLIALATAILCSLPGLLSFFLIPLVVTFAPLVGIGVVVAAVIIAIRRRPRMAGSILIAVLLPPLLWDQVTWAADFIHCGLTVSTGAGQLGHPLQPDGSPFIEYDWSVGLTGGPLTILFYDVTDEIAHPPELRKHPIASEQQFADDCAGNAVHLIRHYYVCRFWPGGH